MQDSPGDGALLHNWLLFARFLRSLGLPVTAPQMHDLMPAFALVGLRRRVDVKAAARALLVNRPEHLAVFELAFDLFWQARDPDELAKLDPARLMPAFPAQAQVKTRHVVGSHHLPDDSLPPQLDRTATASEVERLRRTDFAHLTDDELAQVRAIMQQLIWQPPRRRTRRWQRAHAARHLDLRATLHASLRTGGEALRLRHRTRRTHARPLVILCDVSGSMARYTRILLQFVYALSHRLGAVETFAFSTRLTHLTRALHRRGIDAALEDAVRHVHDWEGGTRIGAALRDFNLRWARRILGRGAIVLLISDGWDRGDPALLSREIARLHRSAHRLIWLNPRLGAPGYTPLVRGMQAALPHLDAFLPVHNLISLEQLAAALTDARLDAPLPPHAWHAAARLQPTSLNPAIPGATP